MPWRKNPTQRMGVLAPHAKSSQSLWRLAWRNARWIEAFHPDALDDLLHDFEGLEEDDEEPGNGKEFAAPPGNPLQDEGEAPG